MEHGSRFVVIKALHPVSYKVVEGSLQSEIFPGSPSIEGVCDRRFAVMIKGHFGYDDHQSSGIFGPSLVETHQQVEKERPIRRVSSSIKNPSRLVVVRRRRPARRFEERQEVVLSDFLT